MIRIFYPREVPFPSLVNFPRPCTYWNEAAEWNDCTGTVHNDFSEGRMIWLSFPQLSAFHYMSLEDSLDGAATENIAAAISSF